MSSAVKKALLAVLSIFAVASAASGLDQQSLDCLACHDAAVATDVTMSVCGGLPNCDHPIGGDYFLLAATNPGLTPPFSLNPAIKLIYGVSIGCGTCHVPYSAVDHLGLTLQRRSYPTIADPMLVMENRKSELCLACHIK